MAQTTTRSPALREFLGKVRPHLPMRESGDILMELEGAVMDRADRLAAGDAGLSDDESIQRAIAEIGQPEAIAASYAPIRYLVEPEAFRGFVLHTGLVFVVHLVLVGIATALSRSFHVILFEIAPVGPNGLVSVLAAAIHAGLLDLGLMAALYAVSGAFRTDGRSLTGSFAVEARRRHALGRAALSLIFALLLAVFRDDVFVVVSETRAYPLFTTWAKEIVPLVTVLLTLAAGKDLLYAICGERRLPVAADALHGLVGVVLMLYLLNGDALLEVPMIQGLEAFREPVNAFLAQVGTLVLAAAALLMGAKTLRRCVRFAQL
jgi:hypothetical protein